jgi:predicted alpha/beta hydrolase family esterase
MKTDALHNWKASKPFQRWLHDGAAMHITALILPGIGNSNADHWQSLWEKANPTFVRVQQADWNNPVCEEWLEVLEQQVAQAGENVVLIAHSLACVLVAHWAAKTKFRIKGALLVAPPDPDGANFPAEAVGFSPLPSIPFGFHSIVVASTNDPYGSIEFSKSCASAWGSHFVSIGAMGHINASSGLGAWPEGFVLWQELAA